MGRRERGKGRLLGGDNLKEGLDPLNSIITSESRLGMSLGGKGEARTQKEVKRGAFLA